MRNSPKQNSPKAQCCHFRSNKVGQQLAKAATFHCMETLLVILLTSIDIKLPLRDANIDFIYVSKHTKKSNKPQRQFSYVFAFTNNAK